jgi:hypothetical protein
LIISASAKQQQWRVINYAALVYAALFFVRDKGWFATEGGKELLTLIACTAFAFSVLMLCDLQVQMGKFRRRIASVYRNSFSPGQRSELELMSKDSMWDFGIATFLAVASFIGALLIIVLIHTANNAVAV